MKTINTPEELYNWIRGCGIILGLTPGDNAIWRENLDTETGKGSAEFVLQTWQGTQRVLEKLGTGFRYQIKHNPELGHWGFVVTFPRVNN